MSSHTIRKPNDNMLTIRKHHTVELRKLNEKLKKFCLTNRNDNVSSETNLYSDDQQPNVKLRSLVVMLDEAKQCCCHHHC